MEKWTGLEEAARQLVENDEQYVWVELRDCSVRARIDDGKIKEDYPWALLSAGISYYKTVEEAKDAILSWIQEYLWEEDMTPDDMFDCRDGEDMQEVVSSEPCENAKAEQAAEFDEEAFKNFAVRVCDFKEVVANENGKIRYIRVPIIK